jgi:phosphohistidine phosphatase SixA
MVAAELCLAARTARRDTMAPRQIVILRHAEKPDDPREPDLSPEGDARAQMLASLIPRRFPNPDWLFCAARSRHSNRPYDTLAPLAQVLRMALDERYADDGYAELAADLLQKPRYTDKLIVICWHHGHIPDLALSLGVAQAALAAAPGIVGLGSDPTVFDRFWILDFSNGRISFSSVLEQ